MLGLASANLDVSKSPNLLHILNWEYRIVCIEGIAIPRARFLE